MTAYTGSYQAGDGQAMTVHITPERQVLLFPRSVPLVLAPEAAREAARLILAAADGAEGAS